MRTPKASAAPNEIRRFRAFRTRAKGWRVSWPLAIFATLFWVFGCLAFEEYVVIPAVPILLLLVHFLGLTRIRVELDIGADGLQYTSRFEKRFVKWSEVDEIEHDTRGIVVKLRHRRDVTFTVARGEISSLEEASQQETIVRAARTAFHAYEPRSSATATATLMRGMRSNEEWLASLRHRTGFRVATVPSDDLWAIVEDHGAVATARAGAATILMQTATAEEKARLRALAAVCAEPRLHRVLGHIARGENADGEMAELEDDPTSSAARTA